MDDYLIELLKKKKKVNKDEEAKAKDLIKNGVLQEWNKECKTEGDRRLFQILSSEITAGIVASLWPELNQNLMMRWFTDFKEGDSGIKCGVKVALGQITVEQKREEGWRLFEYLVAESFKAVNKKSQAAFVGSLYNKDEFVLRDNFPPENMNVTAMFELLWAASEKKSVLTKLNVALWIGKTIKKESKDAFSKLLDSIKKADAVKLCKTVALGIYDDMKTENPSPFPIQAITIEAKAPVVFFEPVKAVDDLRKWITEKNVETAKNSAEKKELESKVREQEPLLEKLRDRCDRKDEEIVNLKEQLSKEIGFQKELNQKYLQLTEERNTLKKEIDFLTAKYNETIEHLNLQLDKLPQIKIQEFKNKLAGRLRMFAKDVYGSSKENITTNMERVLHTQFQQVFDILMEEDVNIRG